MAYTKQTWADGSAGGTPLSAARLQHVEDGVEAAAATADAAAPSTRTVTAGTGLTGGGDLSANRTLAVTYGTTAGTAAQGNDSRITGAAQKASNLSDLASAATARTNLGLASALRVWATGDADPTVGGTVSLPTGVKWAIVKATADTLPSWVPAGSLIFES